MTLPQPLPQEPEAQPKSNNIHYSWIGNGLSGNVIRHYGYYSRFYDNPDVRLRLPFGFRANRLLRRLVKSVVVSLKLATLAICGSFPMLFGVALLEENRLTAQCIQCMQIGSRYYEGDVFMGALVMSAFTAVIWATGIFIIILSLRKRAERHFIFGRS